MRPEKLPVLKQVLADHNLTGTAQEKADRINNVFDQQGPFECYDIVNFWVMQVLLDPATDYTPHAELAANVLKLHQQAGARIDLTKSAHQTLITAAMNNMEARGLKVTTGHRDAIMELNPDPITLAIRYELGHVRAGNVEDAEALP